MKKSLTILSLMLVSFSGLFSQQNLNSQQVLEKVLANMRSHRTMELDLSIQIKSEFDLPDKNLKANLKIKGKRFLLVSGKELIIGDSVNFYTIDTVSKHIDLEKVNGLNEGEIWPIDLLTFYETGFKSQATGIRRDDFNRRIMCIELLADRDNKLKYSSATLHVDIDKFEIVKIALVRKDGDGATFEIQSMKFDVEMNDSIFTYDKTKYK